MSFMLRISSVSLLASMALAVAGCSSPAEDDEGISAEALTGKLTPAELAAAKADLRAIAYANISQMDQFDAVRAEIDPIVTKLRRHFGNRSAASKLPLVAGAWRQIWSDFPYPGTSLVKMDPTQVYQVVSSEGHYYNIGDQRSFFVFPTTGVLRGSYELEGNQLRVQFTNVGFRFGKLKANTDLVAYADAFESGARSYLGIPGGGQAPKGPVGISGTLETLYVDADLRIERGGQDDFYEDGVVAVEGTSNKLFILDRVTVPAK